MRVRFNWTGCLSWLNNYRSSDDSCKIWYWLPWSCFQYYWRPWQQDWYFFSLVCWRIDATCLGQVSCSAFLGTTVVRIEGCDSHSTTDGVGIPTFRIQIASGRVKTCAGLFRWWWWTAPFFAPSWYQVYKWQCRENLHHWFRLVLQSSCWAFLVGPYFLRTSMHRFHPVFYLNSAIKKICS